VKGTLKYAAVATSTPSGEKSEVRAVDPQNTEVEGKDEKGKPADVFVKAAPQGYILALADKKAAEARAERYGEILRTYVGDLRDQNALAGDYQKTYRVVGDRHGDVLYQVDVAEADKWNPVKGVDLKALRAKDKASFDAVADEDSTISIREEVMDNRDLRAELSKGLLAQFGVEGIKKFFKQDTVFIVRKGMEEKQYALPAEQKVVLNAGWKQVADGVRDAKVEQKG
jgi:hypothetical protein